MNNIRRCIQLVWLLVLCLLTACGTTVFERDSAPARPPGDLASIPDAVPKDEPPSRYGNPPSYEVLGKRYYVLDSSQGYVERGIASWYGTKFHGKRTSSGETYNMYEMTAAHKTLPLPTYVEVINLENQKSVVVKVNDRGPFHENRIIDLSYTAATKLGILAKGTGLVEVRAINPRSPARKSQVAPATTVSMENPGLPGFYIQVGAFSERLNAENLRARLGAINNDLVKISQSAVAGKVLYRVRIGPLASVENADQIVHQLSEMGIDHHIVTD